MSRASIPKASVASAGMVVRQQDLKQPFRSHVVTEVEEIGTGINDLQYKITTNQGEWTFRADEPVTFPRRPDSQLIDWRTDRMTELQYPTPLDLAIGDLLDPEDGPYDQNPDMLHTTQDRNQHSQRVTAVTRLNARPDVIYVNTTSDVGVRHWSFLPHELIKFPRTKQDRAHRSTGYNRFEPQLEGFGPYQRPDGAMIFYVRHPAGGGRWPAWLANPVKIGEEIYFARPPASNEFWPPFVGEGRWDRHPKDPQWGIDVEIDHEPDPKRVTAALDAYADYRKRAGVDHE